MKKIALAVLWMMTICACNSKLALDTDDTIKLGAAFELEYGKTVEVDKTLLSIKFIKVAESRCPKTTTCVWAGEGKVSLVLKHDEETEQLVLKVKGLCEESKNKCGEIKNFRGYDIELISLSPYPLGNKKITQSNYVAKLKVTKGRM